ncbi:sensor histidine kinase [Streptomyces halobius]|uniref:Signal transduction histidine-protein kinase/phosphatase MprB n=1 Tax=Streptomyces halobius TaxID=2879846 RepID=A0ABY4MCL1_9ACTN|nr:HAMP domain-containing sensor histidine kinase [Streptomyces halobius]UQA94514.1 HAMP domain-containing histidine kinase [Streptomyces halobius]
MRRSILLLTAATTALVLAALLVPLSLLARSHAADRATADATARAHSLAASLGGALAGPSGRRSAATLVASANGPGLPRTSVILADGTVLGPPAPVNDAVRLARYGRAFTYEPSGGGRTVLVPVQGVDRGSAVVRVALTSGQLYAGTRASSLAFAGIGAGLMLLGLLFADRLGSRLVGSARRLAAVADRLAGGDLTARAEPSGPPELRLVARQLNHLAERIHGFLTAERENAADLAHRLRTPVAVLRLDAEGLRDPTEAERIAAGVAALERGVDEVIRTARKPLREGAAEAARADLAAVARDRADFWRALAEDQGRALDFTAPSSPVVVQVDGTALAAAVDALIGNVFDHTPEGAGMRITVVRGEGDAGHERPAARLVIEDDGPGFPDGHVPERGNSGGGSTGLGLDIVRRAARESGGAVEFGAVPGGGTRITAMFGAGEGPPR